MNIHTRETFSLQLLKFEGLWVVSFEMEKKTLKKKTLSKKVKKTRVKKLYCSILLVCMYLLCIPEKRGLIKNCLWEVNLVFYI